MICQPLAMFAMALGAAGAVAGAASENPVDVLRTPETRAALEFRFSAADEALLEEIQHACFLYFWKEVGTPAMLVKDRKQAPVSSVAAVGFQLSSLPIGVEHGWVSREEGEQRALAVLRALLGRDDNRKGGMYLHFPDQNTAGPSDTGFEMLASTVDTALLLAGAIPAGAYFGGEVDTLVQRMVAEADWKAYAVAPGGFLSMGWEPNDRKNMAGDGTFHKAKWDLAADEERLIYFLAAGAPDPAHALESAMYYRLKRLIGYHDDLPPYAVSYNGALFTYIFSHCWIDYRGLGADDPGRFGVEGPRVDWFENSRRAVLTHRARCLAEAGRFKTFAADRWGQSACVGRDGYAVPEVRPNLSGKDEWYEGTVAPYAAGSAIMFAPRESVEALRAFRVLKGADGMPFVWRDPSEGGYGLVDAFNLDQNYASDDYVGIDHGPLLLAIENARTGLIWKLFMGHPAARRAVERLQLSR